MSKSHVPSRAIEGIILVCRGHRVILDADPAKLYGVSTKALNQAVKRNRRRFPSDFLMQLTEDEWAEIRNNRSQIVTGSQKHRDPHALPAGISCLCRHSGMGRSPTLSCARRVSHFPPWQYQASRIRWKFFEMVEVFAKLCIFGRELKVNP